MASSPMGSSKLSKSIRIFVPGKENSFEFSRSLLLKIAYLDEPPKSVSTTQKPQDLVSHLCQLKESTSQHNQIQTHGK